MARVALGQNDPYNPINRNIHKWEKMFPKLAARERFCFFYYYNKMVGYARRSTKGNGQVGWTIQKSILNTYGISIVLAEAISEPLEFLVMIEWL